MDIKTNLNNSKYMQSFTTNGSHKSFNDNRDSKGVNINSSDKINNENERYTENDKAKIAKLKQIDKKVKAHENAHKAAAGSLASSGPKYKYKVGPDNNKYAVSGHVSIDTSEVHNNPEATLKKAQQIRSAALAPASPSAQDLKVAMAALKMETKARNELKSSENNINDKFNRTYNINKNLPFLEIIA